MGAYKSITTDIADIATALIKEMGLPTVGQYEYRQRFELCLIVLTNASGRHTLSLSTPCGCNTQLIYDLGSGEITVSSDDTATSALESLHAARDEWKLLTFRLDNTKEVKA